jgi:tRNA1Val (adenine37-N6)-methyltransferase
MFHFKKFSIDDGKAAMKVGTDAVLLGAWVKCGNETRILDIGTGSGILALMMAQRNNAVAIDSVEIDHDAAELARQNFLLSPWAQQISIYDETIQEFALHTESRYSLIVCNPPFFTGSLKTPGKARNLARHNDSLPVTELLDISASLLSEKGKAAFIIPFDAYEHWQQEAAKRNLFPSRATIVKSSPTHKPHRVMIEFTSIKQTGTNESELNIYQSEKKYSFDYQNLTKDFYLNF